MADRADLEFTYSLIDRIFRLSLGEMADFSGAKYDGDFSLSLEEAQRRKHEYVAERIGINATPHPRPRLGLGPDVALRARARRRGVGVTLSSAQAEHAGVTASRCTSVMRGRSPATRSGRSTPSRASARSSTSARRRTTRRAARRRSTGSFANTATVLPEGGRFYLQTMALAPNMIDPGRVSIDAPRDSDEEYLALMQHQFPGSFLPFGSEQIVKTAAPDFRLVETSSGRLDYIETIKQWRARFARPSWRKRLDEAPARSGDG